MLIGVKFISSCTKYIKNRILTRRKNIEMKGRKGFSRDLLHVYLAKHKHLGIIRTPLAGLTIIRSERRRLALPTRKNGTPVTSNKTNHYVAVIAHTCTVYGINFSYLTSTIFQIESVIRLPRHHTGHDQS